MEAIRTMHIGGFFNVCDTLPPSTAGWQEVAVERESCDALRETVIESHEQLIDADERNEKEFGRVVEGFRADQQQSKRGHDQP
ncbi:MAG: hypothetical protein IPK83_17445 [Planctomycetes bacterium]|nr:hypothetical protein [Planctomycetota bacterium]